MMISILILSSKFRKLDTSYGQHLDETRKMNIREIHPPPKLRVKLSCSALLPVSVGLCFNIYTRSSSIQLCFLFQRPVDWGWFDETSYPRPVDQNLNFEGWC